MIYINISPNDSQKGLREDYWHKLDKDNSSTLFQDFQQPPGTALTSLLACVTDGS